MEKWLGNVHNKQFTLAFLVNHCDWQRVVITVFFDTKLKNQIVTDCDWALTQVQIVDDTALLPTSAPSIYYSPSGLEAKSNTVLL